jgi:hypothetical protein
LDEVFQGVNRGEEVLRRLLPFYELSKDAAEHAYFVVRNPIKTTERELLQITKEYFERTRKVAVVWEAADLVTLLDSTTVVVRKENPPPPSPIPEPNAALIHWTLGDWFIDLEQVPSDLSLLYEAFYSMACDYMLARYLMWPIYREATEIDDPFEPYYQLWSRGVDYRFSDDRFFTLYVPSLSS